MPVPNSPLASARFNKSIIPRFIKCLFTLTALMASFVCFGQDYLRANEELILSFQTNTHKEVYLVKDKSNKYISYRFGSSDKIELEYPSTQKDSWTKFTYSYYLRGGGAGNEGMDLNYVYFTNNGFRYVIYQTYYAVENKSYIGIKVIDLKTNKTVDIKGNMKTRKGTLVDFRYNRSLKISDELFE